MSSTVHNLFYLPPRELFYSVPVLHHWGETFQMFHCLFIRGLELQQLEPPSVGHLQAGFQRRLCCHMATYIHWVGEVVRCWLLWAHLYEVFP